MTKNILYFVILFLLFSCSAKKENESNTVLSQQLYNEGRNLLSERINIQKSDPVKAKELNKKVIEKFEAAYNADKTNLHASQFASECTMYERDYKNCLNWTLKFVEDTAALHKAGFSDGFIADFYERIGECYDQVGKVEKSRSYYEKASALKNKSSVIQ